MKQDFLVRDSGQPFSVDKTLMSRKRWFAFCALVLIVSNVQAIDVQETTDFPGSSSFAFGVSVGELDPGGNTVSGTLDGVCAPNDCNGAKDGDTQDSFLVTVPEGYLIESIEVTSANIGGVITLIGFGVRSPEENIAFVNIPVNSNSGNVLTDPVPAGEYSLSVFGRLGSEAGPFTLDWSVSISIVPAVEIFQDRFDQV
ncbi:hypothetical protein [Wenzhouxiangella marina]|uniref:Uncharacterized protein n=1 Tax=Wenzhouxiangella marina TaxID=1579979 RepID=A0A0K0Y000_9GAMM|nr:hypothetical protein [Wenzhouxiangella marina]AKS43268.1 hypothetical protein WM2015_2911 [Wenzhouxiangella marina]MBB6087045.1 hypothetical protein [Wenzhouxiangella marina]